jgi:hypothetical protein
MRREATVGGRAVTRLVTRAMAVENGRPLEAMYGVAWTLRLAFFSHWSSSFAKRNTAVSSSPDPDSLPLVDASSGMEGAVSDESA